MNLAPESSIFDLIFLNMAWELTESLKITIFDDFIKFKLRFKSSTDINLQSGK